MQKLLKKLKSKAGYSLTLFSSTFWFALYDRSVHHDLGTKAAALAFYLACSIAPLFLLLITALGILDLDLAVPLSEKINQLVGRDAANIFYLAAENIENKADPPSSSGVLSLLSLIVFTSAIFGQMQSGFKKIFLNTEDVGAPFKLKTKVKSLLKARLLAILMIISFILIIVSSLAFSVTLRITPTTSAWYFKLLNGLGDLTVFTFIFAMAFKVLPPIPIKFSSSLFSGFISAILFIFGKDLISLYVRTSALSSTQGAAGLPIALFIWLYYSSFVIFLGAEILAYNEKIRAPS